MNHLLYCVVHQEVDGPPSGPGAYVLAIRGLAAVVSLVEGTNSAPGVSSLLAYEKVVETFHARQTVIPLRYGCLMESESAIIRLLEEHRQEYEALLGRLCGMSEMGIRVLCPARPEPLPGCSMPPGAAYLASLRSRYGREGCLAPEEAQLADWIAGPLTGCYAEERREIAPTGQGRLLSQYFLTPQSSVEAFRNRVRHVRPPGGARLLLSGPWPPYNFAASFG